LRRINVGVYQTPQISWGCLIIISGERSALDRQGSSADKADPRKCQELRPMSTGKKFQRAAKIAAPTTTSLRTLTPRHNRKYGKEEKGEFEVVWRAHGPQ